MCVLMDIYLLKLFKMSWQINLKGGDNGRLNRQTMSLAIWNDGTQAQAGSHWEGANLNVRQTDPPIDLDESDAESDAGDGGRSDSEGVGNAQDDEKHKLWLPPSIEAAHAAHTQLDAILNP